MFDTAKVINENLTSTCLLFTEANSCISARSFCNVIEVKNTSLIKNTFNSDMIPILVDCLNSLPFSSK